MGFRLGFVRVLSFTLPPLAALVIGYLFREQISPFIDVVFGAITSAQDATLGGYALFVFIALSVAIGYSVFWITRSMVRVFALAYPNRFMRLAGGALTLALAQLVLWFGVSFGLASSADSWWVRNTQPFAPQWVLRPAQQLQAVVPLDQLPGAYDATRELLDKIDIQEAASKIKIEDIKELGERVKNINSDSEAAAADLEARERQKLEQIQQTQVGRDK